MRFSCPRQSLSDVLSILTEVTPSRSAKPVLQNVLIEGNDDGTITLSATDLEIGLRYRLQVDDLVSPCTVLLPAARLAGLVRDDWAATLQFQVEGDRAEITTENGRFHLMGSGQEDFPPVPGIEGKEVVQLLGEDIADAVHKTVFATARSDTRFALNGIFLSIDKNTVDFVASDTHRLSLVKKKGKNKGGVKAEAIIITKGMTTLAKLAQGQEQVSLQITPHQLIAETSVATLVTRLVDGQFPRYRDVIPKDLDKSITVERELFAKTLRLAGQLTNEETRCIALAAAGDKVLLNVSGSDVGDGQIEMDATVEGGDISAAFNYVYIVDVLRVLSEDTVTLQLRDSDHPARLTVGDFTHIIMPIKPRG